MRHFEREALIWASGLDTNSKILLLAINQYIGSKETAWPSTETLAQDTSLSRSTVLRRIEFLEEQSILKIQRRYNQGMQTSSEYTINWSTLGVISVTANPSIRQAVELNESRGVTETLPENKGCHGDTAGKSGVSQRHSRGVRVTHRTNPNRTNPIEESSTNLVQDKPEPIALPIGTRKQKSPTASFSGEDIRRIIAAYNANKSPHWSKLEMVGTDRQKILKKWLNDMGSVDAVIDAIVKALKFASKDDFWSGKNGDARRLNFETLNDKGHLCAWVEEYNRLERVENGKSASMDAETEDIWERFKALAKRTGHTVETLNTPNMFLFDGRTKPLQVGILKGLIAEMKAQAQQRA